MNQENWTGIIIGIIIIGSIVALGLMIHSCGSRIEAKCPNGGSITVQQTGQLGGEEPLEGICKKAEEGGS